MAEKKKKNLKRWKLYEVSDKLIRKNKFCPKCSEGVVMAKHKDRYTCGKCNYCEFMPKA